MKALSVRLENYRGIPLQVQLECDAGRVLAIVGPSGSGKTTVLRSIAGLFRPETGLIQCHDQIWLDTGRNIFIPPKQRHVGMLFQNYALFPHLSVRRNITIAMQKNAAVHVDDLLASVNLHGLEDRIPATLSGGQQQRVALARALARQPDVLLLDEPFSAVDQVTRRKLRLELKQLIRALDIPIILVTHDLDEAAMLSDTLCVLHNGSSLQIGTPDEVLQAPNSSLVARLMDVRNLFQGRVIDQDGQTTRIDWAGYTLEIARSITLHKNQIIHWCITADKVLLHRRVQPSRGIHENPVSGQICELVKVAGVTNVIVSLDTNPAIKLHMDLPPHVVERNQLRVGEQIGMSLLKNAIHITGH